MAKKGHPRKKNLLALVACSLLASLDARAWGELGHRLTAEHGARLAGPEALAGCHLNETELVAHVNDPDSKWRNQRILHPHEARAHFFHVDRQPKDWRTRSDAADLKQGFLVYRIVDWAAEAKKLRAAGKWDALKERLYGIAHYLGDLSQPLHVHHDYDGDEAGVAGVHSQFETKMLNRFENRVRTQLDAKLALEKIPALWSGLSVKELVFNVGEQSHAKAAPLLERSRSALASRKPSKKNPRARERAPRFVKQKLWEATGETAVNQLALGARMIGHVLRLVCR
ncbi:MAG: hypothetical protein HYW49_10025 [Deltaproteobacteria bacterium]|nr:hypothetical protein [Deltaproteobacteria bacterium]